LAEKTVDITALTDEERAKLFTEATEWLLTIPEPKRSEYTKQVISSIIEATKQISALPKLPQLQAAAALLGEIAQNSPTILPAFLYTVKPEFRDFYEPILTEAIDSLIKYILTQAQK
jgi:hypothetical protein